MTFALYTIAEAAQHLNIKKATLRNRVKAAELSIHKVGSQDVITKDVLDLLEEMGDPEKGRRPKQGRKT